MDWGFNRYRLFNAGRIKYRKRSAWLCTTSYICSCYRCLGIFMPAFWYIVIAILLRIRRHFWCVEMDVVKTVSAVRSLTASTKKILANHLKLHAQNGMNLTF